MVSSSLAILVLIVAAFFALGAATVGPRLGGGNRRMAELVNDLKQGNVRGYAVLATAVIIAVLMQYFNQ